MIKPCGFRNMNCLMKSWTLAMKMDLNLFLPLDEEDFQALKALQTHFQDYIFLRISTRSYSLAWYSILSNDGVFGGLVVANSNYKVMEH